ncbi:MAG: LytTR family transcriptional regulator DNA-binding domain-containing protein [Clostridia bacterium]|nr:LytTR family transcriptional regulator DNA-binding domain-containing protein [Clostridia bacterium]
MKCRTVIDKDREEEVVIYVHEKNSLSYEIEELVLGKSLELFGYKDKNIVKLSPSDVFCFTVENNKVYAICEKEKYQIKQRLYLLEEILDKDFVKINQSCIANIRKISKFDTSITGTLMVSFKNGHRDYVSRRQMKKVKERIGF